MSCPHVYHSPGPCPACAEARQKRVQAILERREASVQPKPEPPISKQRKAQLRALDRAGAMLAAYVEKETKK